MLPFTIIKIILKNIAHHDEMHSLQKALICIKVSPGLQ